MSFRNLSRRLSVLTEAKAPAKGKVAAAPTEPVALAKYLSDLPKSNKVTAELLGSFKGNNKKVTVTGATFDSDQKISHRMAIENVTFKNCKFVGMKTSNYGFGVVDINDCVFDGCVFDGSSLGTSEVYCNDVVYKNCTFKGDGYIMLKQPEGDGHNITISNCTMDAGFLQLHNTGEISNFDITNSEIEIVSGYTWKGTNTALRNNTIRKSKVMLFDNESGDEWPTNLFDGLDVGTWTFEAEGIDDLLAFYRGFDWKGTKGLDTAKGLPDGFLKEAKKRGIVPQQYSLVLGYDGYAKEVQVFDTEREAIAASKQFSCQLYVVVGNQQENEPIGQTDDGDRGEADLLRDFRI